MLRKPTRRDLLIGVGAAGIASTAPAGRSWSARTVARPTLFVDSELGDDGRDGRTPATAWRTLSRVSAAGEGAAGEVVGMARGRLWREVLRVPASRMSFVPYGSGAKPVVCGAEPRTEWLADRPFGRARTWSAAQLKDPGLHVFADHRRLTPAPSRLDMDEGSFWWDGAAKRLHVWLRGGADPRAHRMEVAKQATCCDVADVADVRLYGIVFEKARRYGLKARAGVARLTAVECEFMRNGLIGIHIGDGSEAGERTAEHPDAAIIACRAAYNLGSGIVGLNRVTRIRIVGTVAHHNAQTDRLGDYHGNIRIVSDFVPGATELPQNRPAECLIEGCVSYAAGKDESGRTVVSSERGHGIWLDTAGPRSWIRYCRSFDNAKSGVYYEWGGDDCAGGLEGNLAYGNETGVLLARRTAGAVVRNNTAVANGTGLWITGEWGGESDRYGFRDNQVYDNVAVDNGVNLLVSWGAEERSNSYHHNCFGRERGGFVQWGFDRPLDSYEALEAAHGAKMHNVEAEPMISLSANGELSVAPGSPILGAGADGSDVGADPAELPSAQMR